MSYFSWHIQIKVTTNPARSASPIVHVCSLIFFHLNCRTLVFTLETFIHVIICIIILASLRMNLQINQTNPVKIILLNYST